VRRFVLCAVLIGATAAAQSPADIERCTGIAADSERLACYDKLFSHRVEQASPTPSKPAAVAAPAAAGAAAAVSTATKGEAAAGAATSTAAKSAPASAPSTTPATKTADDFGLDGRTPKGTKEEEKKPEAPSEMTARVASVATQAGGQYVLTLDNGQVWEQQHPDWHLAFKVGDEVIVKRGTFKSYRLWLKGNSRFTAVTRIR
jgi:hypothetical protein